MSDRPWTIRYYKRIEDGYGFDHVLTDNAAEAAEAEFSIAHGPISVILRVPTPDGTSMKILRALEAAFRGGRHLQAALLREALHPHP